MRLGTIKGNEDPPGLTRRALVFALWLLSMCGCASYKPAPAAYQPQLARAQTATNGPVIASVAVLSREEAEEMFDLPLHKKDIQPVWLRLRNTRTHRLYFLTAGLDPEYHPPGEVAYLYRKSLAGKRNRRVVADLEARRLDPSLAPGTTREGYVFSHQDPGAKHVRLDVIGTEVPPNHP